MPSVKNKLLINSGRVQGRNASIHNAHEVMREYAEEIAEHNWLGRAEVLAFRARMEKLCAVYNPSQDAYDAGCWELADDMRKFIDSQMFPPSTP